jgi:hypothetical protein
MSHQDPNMQIEHLLGLLNDKGCTFSCCGIDAFHQGKKIQEELTNLLIRHRESLAAWIANCPSKTSSELVGSISAMEDLCFFLNLEESESLPNRDNLVHQMQEKSRELQRKLAIVRHKRRS